MQRIDSDLTIPDLRVPCNSVVESTGAVDKRPRGKVPLRRQKNPLEFLKVLPTRGKYD